MWHQISIPSYMMRCIFITCLFNVINISTIFYKTAQILKKLTCDDSWK